MIHENHTTNIGIYYVPFSKRIRTKLGITGFPSHAAMVQGCQIRNFHSLGIVFRSGMGPHWELCRVVPEWLEFR